MINFFQFNQSVNNEESNVIKMNKTRVKQLTLLTSILVSASAFAASWQPYLSTHYRYTPSPYQFTNMRDCNWNYVTSYGGRWGVQHLYKASGSCPFSEQKVNYTQGGGYNNTVVYHR